MEGRLSGLPAGEPHPLVHSRAATSDFFRKSLIFSISHQAPKQHRGKPRTLTSAQVLPSSTVFIRVTVGGTLILQRGAPQRVGWILTWSPIGTGRPKPQAGLARVKSGTESRKWQVQAGQGWPARKPSAEHGLGPSPAQPVGSLSGCACPGCANAYTAPVPGLARWCRDVATISQEGIEAERSVPRPQLLPSQAESQV